MNVASLELCKELYELSGWFDTSYKHYEINGEYQLKPSIGIHDEWGGEGRNVLSMLAPAYDLGYLLRKLPASIIEKDGAYRGGAPRQLSICTNYRVLNTEPLWVAGYGKAYANKADTPEDAACKLTIELFKQDVLKGKSDA